MEEQPRDRQPERHYPRHQQPHAEDRPSAPDLNGVKHEQIHLQHQETQAKKTGSRRLTSGSEQDAEKTSPCPAGMSNPPVSHGNRHVINSTLKQPHPGSASSTLASAAGPPRAAGRNASAELRRQQSSDQLRPGKDKEAGQGEAKHGAAPVPNGLTCAPLTNGYSSSKPAADGAGQGGYSGQKKPRARGGAMVRNAENVIREAERGAPSPDGLDKGPSSRLEGPRGGGPRGEGPGAAAAEPQRKNGEGKAVAVFGKKPDEKHKGGGGGGKHSSSPSKEDSWTLFKPPPVFPVDNSSAKIVPKISYASKVKENLNKEAAAAAAAAVAAAAPPPAPVRLSQVPMSAMKTISSVSFTNGPLPGNGHPLGGTYFAPGAAQASCLPAGDAVAPMGPSGGGDAFELKKCALLIYPLNMQPVLPSARPHHPQAPQTNQKALGEIFQNQWGLSFINEPGLGPEGGDKAAAGPPAPEPVTFAPDSRRTCVPHGRSATFGALSPEREDEDEPGVRGADTTRLEPRGPGGGGVAAQAREGGTKAGPSSLPTLTFGSSKDRSPPGGLDRRASWGGFDVRAAVTYHTKEIEYIFNLQKQDPKRVVLYQESQDGAPQ